VAHWRQAGVTTDREHTRPPQDPTVPQRHRRPRLPASPLTFSRARPARKLSPSRCSRLARASTACSTGSHKSAFRPATPMGATRTGRSRPAPPSTLVSAARSVPSGRRGVLPARPPCELRGPTATPRRMRRQGWPALRMGRRAGDRRVGLGARQAPITIWATPGDDGN
jgi:hypothetical protein